MAITYRSEKISTFTITPRTMERDLYLSNIKDTVRWTAKHGFTGVLLFSGNDTYIDPWLVAQTVLLETTTLAPLVAVNPVFMHPFTAAKMVSSLAYMYNRQIWLNMITGTAVSYLQALDNQLAHDQRYVAMQEYIQVMQALLAKGTPTTFNGKFYSVTGAQLLPRVPDHLLPRYLLAGQSEAALATAKSTGAVSMQMLAPDLEKSVKPGVTGIHFGVVARPGNDEAWRAAKARFPEDPEGQELLDLSMSNTDSVWKQRMKKAADAKGYESIGYWMVPFRNFMADCPYFVGSYAQTASMISRLVLAGIREIILDVPAADEEFGHTRACFDLAEKELGR